AKHNLLVPALQSLPLDCRPVSTESPMSSSSKSTVRQGRVLPGFTLTLGYTLFYLSLIVLLPMAAVFMRAAEMDLAAFWQVVSSPRLVASYRLSFGAALLAALINSVFGLMLAWALVRYSFPGRKLVDALVDLP